MVRALMVGTAACFAAAVPPESCQAGGNAQSVAAGHDMSGKTVFLTGGDTGIGYNVALALASVNASIIMSNHNAGKGEAAAANITRLTGNSHVEALQVDLMSFESTRALASSVLAKHPTLDVVIFDAGIGGDGAGGSELTEDGFEKVMQVNYLGHFLLEQLFLPSLRAANGKLIHVSSASSYNECDDAQLPAGCIDDFAVLEKMVRTTIPTASYYGISKLMQFFNSRELATREAARGSGVRAYAVRPGPVDTPLYERTMTPDTEKHLCSYPQCAAGRTRLGMCQTPCPMPAAAGASTPTFIAVTDGLSERGMYFQCEVEEDGTTWGNAQEQNQKALYDMSLKWTGTDIADTKVLV